MKKKIQKDNLMKIKKDKKWLLTLLESNLLELI